MPVYICPNCRERSVDIDGFEGFSTNAPQCRSCGFGFLFQLLEDYYPAPSTGLRRLRPRRTGARGRARRLRADGLPGGRPDRSTAFHILVSLYPQVPVTVTSLNKLIVTLLHASLAVGAVNVGVPVHSTVASTPCPPIVGGVVSVTVIVCDTVDDTLPHPSTAFHVLVLYSHMFLLQSHHSVSSRLHCCMHHLLSVL